MRIRTLMRAAVPVVLLTLSLGACGGSDDNDGGSQAAETEDTTEVCKLATEMYESEEIPTAAQFEAYREVAPDEIKDAVETAGPAVIEADGDQAKFFVAIAEDDVEDAAAEINAWEEENCDDIDHEDVAPDEVTEVDADAKRVDVTASDYSFAFTKTVPAGPVSFVMKNAGKEVHYMGLTQILEGHTLEEALSFEGDPEEAGLVKNAEFDSKLAAPGGDDEEVLTLDMAAGNWAMVCFIPAADGTPHAFKGMAIPFTVS